MENIKKKLINQAENPEELSQKLKEMATRLQQSYNESLKSLSPELDKKIAECINIPNHVLLPEDLPVRDAKDKNLSEINNEITALKEQLKIQAYMKQVMEDEINEANNMVSLYTETMKTSKEVDFQILPVEEMFNTSKEVQPN